MVNASFHVTHWSVQPYGTGISRMKYVGFVFGGDVLRFFHGGDECLTIPGTWSRETGQKYVLHCVSCFIGDLNSINLYCAAASWCTRAAR